jgi:hypothetical protein
MKRLDRIRLIAMKHGVSLAEYVVLDVVSTFALTPDEVVKYASATLHGSSFEDLCCGNAIASCAAKALVAQVDDLLVLTEDGSTLRKSISREVTQRA